MNNFLTVIKKTILTLLSFMAITVVKAQTETPEMADTMRSNGKIYVVVTVCLIILIGLFLYVVKIDKKLSKLEKETQLDHK